MNNATDDHPALYSPISLDQFDQRILDALRSDGRLTIVELSERIGLSQTPVRRRVTALESAGVIAGYSARINRRALGFGVKAFLEIKLETHRRQHTDLLQSALADLPQITAIYVISGTGDVLLEVNCRDLEEYERLLIDTICSLPIVKEVRTSFVMRTLKQDDVASCGNASSGIAKL